MAACLIPMSNETDNIAVKANARPVPACALPPRLEPIFGPQSQLSSLSALERVMVACDGTFTFQLETYLGETIEVEILDYRSAPLPETAAHLMDAAPQSLFRERKVLLKGARTGRPHVFAHSWVNASALPRPLQSDLEDSPMGIGRLFVDYRLSTYRELLGYFYEDGSEYASFFPGREKLSFLARVYRVLYNDSVVMLITEKMPRDLFAAH